MRQAAESPVVFLFLPCSSQPDQTGSGYNEASVTKVHISSGGLLGHATCSPDRAQSQSASWRLGASSSANHRGLPGDDPAPGPATANEVIVADAPQRGRLPAAVGREMHSGTQWFSHRIKSAKRSSSADPEDSMEAWLAEDDNCTKPSIAAGPLDAGLGVFGAMCNVSNLEALCAPAVLCFHSPSKTCSSTNHRIVPGDKSPRSKLPERRGQPSPTRLSSAAKQIARASSANDSPVKRLGDSGDGGLSVFRRTGSALDAMLPEMQAQTPQKKTARDNIDHPLSHEKKVGSLMAAANKTDLEKRFNYCTSSNLEPGSYEWLLEQDRIHDQLRQMRSDVHSTEKELKMRCVQEEALGDAALRTMRMKLTLKDVPGAEHAYNKCVAHYREANMEDGAFTEVMEEAKFLWKEVLILKRQLKTEDTMLQRSEATVVCTTDRIVHT